MRIALIGLGVWMTLASPAMAADWPAWRGPAGNGITQETNLPESWSQTENVTWKAPLPGPGNSTPVVFGDRVFLTAASDKGAVRSVICFDRADGKQLWRRDTKFSGQEPTHETNHYCSASPVTDGKRVFAWHGSAGVFAYFCRGGLCAFRSPRAVGRRARPPPPPPAGRGPPPRPPRFLKKSPSSSTWGPGP